MGEIAGTDMVHHFGIAVVQEPEESKQQGARLNDEDGIVCSDPLAAQQQAQVDRT